MKKLILLRPNTGALQSAAIARGYGFDPIIAPASEIHPLPWDMPPAHDFDAIMITSANALRMANKSQTKDALRQYSHLPLFAVGQATAQLARDMGFTIAAIGKGGAKALWPLIREYGAKNIVRLVGRDYVPLDDKPVNFTTIMTYEARALPMHSALEKLLQQNDGPHIFAFHSARAVQIFDNYIEELADKGFQFDKSAHFAAALAPTIGHAIRNNNHSPWRDIIISSSASDSVMIAEIAETLGA